MKSMNLNINWCGSRSKITTRYAHIIQLYQGRHKVLPHSLMIFLQFNIPVNLLHTKRLKLTFHCDGERTQKSQRIKHFDNDLLVACIVFADSISLVKSNEISSVAVFQQTPRVLTSVSAVRATPTVDLIKDSSSSSTTEFGP